MNFIYLIKFDEQGEIGCFCKDKPKDCSEKCKEYIVKLIPINRDVEKESVNEFVNSLDMLSDEAHRLTSEIKKAGSKIRRY